MTRLSDLFRQWDLDGDGTIDLQEFQRAAVAVGMPDDPVAAEKLFREFDRDGSGRVEYKEYLRYSLRETLQRSSARVIDLFKQLDVSGRGAVDLGDFLKGVRALGYEASDEDLTMLFHEWDTNHSGMIEFRELNSQMRQTVGGSKQLTKQASRLIMRSKANLLAGGLKEAAEAGLDRPTATSPSPSDSS